MKPIILLFLCPLSFIFFSCNLSHNYQMDKMTQSVKKHIKNNDQQEGILTQIENIKPIDYKEIPENQRKDAQDFYFFRIYIKAKWSYINSYRVYNIDDTLTYCFDKNKKFIRSINKVP